MRKGKLPTNMWVSHPFLVIHWWNTAPSRVSYKPHKMPTKLNKGPSDFFCHLYYLKLVLPEDYQLDSTSLHLWRSSPRNTLRASISSAWKVRPFSLSLNPLLQNILLECSSSLNVEHTQWFRHSSPTTLQTNTVYFAPITLPFAFVDRPALSLYHNLSLSCKVSLCTACLRACDSPLVLPYTAF